VHKSVKQNKTATTLPVAAVERLCEAGWKPGREISTRVYEDAYRSEGRSLLPKAKEFLRGFGGLIIRYPTKAKGTDVLAFLADREVRAMDGSGVQCFEELIGVAPLCPIGHYQFGTCILFMDKRGYVFGGSDETISLIGQTGDEAVGNILTGVESLVLEPKAETKRR
jgi:hypothetical protein